MNEEFAAALMSWPYAQELVNQLGYGKVALHPRMKDRYAIIIELADQDRYLTTAELEEWIEDVR